MASMNQLCFLWKFIIFGFLFMMIENCGFTEAALRGVKLVVIPPAVRRGHSATLRCVYDLNGAPLYSVKFYRGQLEFYRFNPAEHPSIKVFPFPGFHVDTTVSNASQVVLRNVGFPLSGNFSCEVTADAPFFSTATAVATMQVVELPEKRPYLWTDQDRYVPNDILRANCSTPPSKPRSILKFTLNNIVLNNVETEYSRTIDGLETTSINLRIVLLPSHFIPGPSYGVGGSSGSTSFSGQIFNLITSSTSGSNTYANNYIGSLVLRCTAQIDELYQESTELELGGQQKDPIPARVTSSLSTRPQCFQKLYSILILVTISSIFLNFFNIFPVLNQFSTR